ncbi:MAG: arginase [Alphaproteobacteria bacterium]|nr:arginase [Alphaproteobacteria bacterium]
MDANRTIAETQKPIALLGVPLECGTDRRGCIMGPDALRCAGLAEALKALGCAVRDLGNLSAMSGGGPARNRTHRNGSVANLDECARWIAALQGAAFSASSDGCTPIFMGGDHLMAAGTASGVARIAEVEGREQFVLWLDAHTDFHTLASTLSGNLHGTPVAYFTGQAGFGGYYPDLAAPIKCENICMMGIRSVDLPELDRLRGTSMNINDMRQVDEGGIAPPLRAFLDRVRDANGRLHVSLDVDFLDPAIAPAVGTTVPGGASFREAHLVMEILHDSALVTSLDIAELNPFLDERGRTASVLVDLVASLFGKRVMDRPTRSY